MSLALRDVARLAAEWQLEILGGFYPEPEDPLPKGTQTVLLLGPAQPGFWRKVSGSPEFADGAPDPLDRWSTRALGELAESCASSAVFPFGGPPWLPFIGWSERTGRVWSSPAGLLVHATQGLWVSFRGGLAFKERLELPAPLPCPCDTCADKPCLSACPVSALTPSGYDVSACHAGLDDGLDCMTKGCAARAACPISQSHPRALDQSAFHMRAFHP
ncbi:MAG: ferredoxin [Pseudomonadota bacterium]